MVASPTLTVTHSSSDQGEQGLAAAANAVFGVLALIAESPCDEETERNIAEASRSARAQVARLGARGAVELGTGLACPLMGDSGSSPDGARVIPLHRHRKG